MTLQPSTTIFHSSWGPARLPISYKQCWCLPHRLAGLSISTIVDPSSIATKQTETCGVSSVCGWLWKTFLVPNCGKYAPPGPRTFWEVSVLSQLKVFYCSEMGYLLSSSFISPSINAITNLSLTALGQQNYKFKLWKQNCIYYTPKMFPIKQRAFTLPSGCCDFPAVWLVSSLSMKIHTVLQPYCGCPLPRMELPLLSCLASRGDR